MARLKHEKLLTVLLVLLVMCVLLLSDVAVEAKKKGKAATILESNESKKVKTDSSDEAVNTTNSAAASTPTPTTTSTLADTESSVDRAKLDKRAKKRALKLESRRAVAANQHSQQRHRRVTRVAALRQARQNLYKSHNKSAVKASKVAKLSAEQKQKAIDKLRLLKSLSAKSPNHIISLTYQQYLQLIVDQIRPYWLFVCYTALTAANQCSLCQELQRSIIPFANTNYEKLQKQQDFTQLLSTEHVATVRDKDYPLYFVNVDVARTDNLFSQMNLKTAPSVVMLPPKFTKKPADVATLLNTVPSKHKLQLTSQRINLNDIVQFINKVSGRELVPDFSAITFEEIAILILLSVVVSVCLYYFYDRLIALRSNRRLRFVVTVLAWCVYSWCISGGMYNIQKGSLFAALDRERNQIAYINPDARDQFGAEGLIVAAVLCTASVMLALTNYRAYHVMTMTGISKKWYENIVIGISPFLSPYVCLAGTILAWQQIVEIYTRKNHGYRRGFVWF